MVEPAKKEELKEEIVNKQITDGIKAKINPFVSTTKGWEDKDHFKLPASIQKGIVETLNFPAPSKIQVVAIPMISQPNEDGNYDHLIAQSRNGSGKTGAFSIGSLLRVDPAIEKPQVVVLCHTRELAFQVTSVYRKATSFAPEYKISCLLEKVDKKAQVLVTSLGRLFEASSGRNNLELSSVKVVVIDEADFFFDDEKNFTEILKLKNIVDNVLKIKPQYVLFSATYSGEVNERIKQLLSEEGKADDEVEANQIQLKSNASLKLDHVKQFYYKCGKREKINFLESIFETCAMTQTVIFVNTLNFAETVHRVLKEKGYKASIIFSRMSHEERDEFVEKFRKQEINVILTTNLLARGLDVPEVQLVINFDVPKNKVRGVFEPDEESYQHRIGRAGRFGAEGIALTLFDNPDDEQIFNQTIRILEIKPEPAQLKGPEHLKELLMSLDAAGI